METKQKIMTLDQLSVGESCEICQVGNQRGAVKRRLVDMGLTPGTEVKLIKIAPFGDPLELRLRGYELSLRKEDAAQIRVRPISAKDGGKQAVPETAYHLGGGCHGDCAHCAVGCADPQDLEAMRRAHRHEQSQHPQHYDPHAHDQHQWKVALVGNPNAGKTTLFNALTGSNQYVGNWPGVTVEKKEGIAQVGELSFTLVDLPGIYSLSPYSMEEIVARKFIIEEKPDAIINIVDATNLERNLYLTMQLLELERPTVLALNFMDEVEKKGITIDCEPPLRPAGDPGDPHLRPGQQEHRQAGAGGPPHDAHGPDPGAGRPLRRLHPRHPPPHHGADPRPVLRRGHPRPLGRHQAAGGGRGGGGGLGLGETTRQRIEQIARSMRPPAPWGTGRP